MAGPRLLAFSVAWLASAGAARFNVLTRRSASAPLFPPSFHHAVIGLSFGSGIIVYQIAKSGDDGLARIEIGRSRYVIGARPTMMGC